jgi:hypothetical protein
VIPQVLWHASQPSGGGPVEGEAEALLRERAVAWVP